MGERLNMKKNEIRKYLIFGIIVLFVGASTVPNINSELYGKESEGFELVAEDTSPCPCPSLDDPDSISYEEPRSIGEGIEDEYPPIGTRFNWTYFVEESAGDNSATYTINLGGVYGDTIVAHLETFTSDPSVVDKTDNITFFIYGEHHTVGTLNEEYVCGYDDVQDVKGVHDSIFITSLPIGINDIDITVNAQNSKPRLLPGSFIEIRDADKRIESVGASGDYYCPYTHNSWYTHPIMRAQQAQAWVFADGYHLSLRARSDLQVYNAKGFDPLEWVSEDRKADVVFGVSWAGTADTNSAWPGVGEYAYYLGGGISATNNLAPGIIHWTRIAQQRLAKGGFQMDEQAYIEDIRGTLMTTLVGEVVEEAIGFPVAGEILDILQFTIALMSTDETIADAAILRYDDIFLNPDVYYFLYIKVREAARAGGVGTGYVNFLYSGDPFTDLQKTNDYKKGIWFHNALIYYHPVGRPVIEIVEPTKTLFRNDDSILFQAEVPKGKPLYDFEWTATTKNKTTGKKETVKVFKTQQNVYTNMSSFYNHSFDTGRFLITVKVTDGDGGTDTDSYVIEVLEPPPKPEINLSHSEIEVYKVYLLEWEHVEGASHYYVTEWRDDWPTYYSYRNQTWTWMPFLKKDDDADHVFLYKVVACNRLGQETKSNGTLMKIKRQPLNVPEILDLDPQHGSNQTYSVHWKRGDGWKDGWHLQEYQWVNLTANQTSYMERVLINDTKIYDDCPNPYTVNQINYCHCDPIRHDDENITVYEYQLAEMEKVGFQYYDGPWSKNVSTEIIPPPQSAPTLIQPEHSTAWGVYYKIEWIGNVSTATEYYMEEDDEPTFSYPLVSKRWLSNATNFTHFIKNQAAQAGTYYYRMRAENREYDQYKMVGPWSNIVNKTVVGYGIKPGKPNVTVSDSIVDSGQEYTVRWDRVDGEQIYKVQESTSAYFPDNHTSTWLTNGLGQLPPTSFTRKYTRNNTQSYFYRVKGLAAGAQEGNWSDLGGVEVQVIGDKAPTTPRINDPGEYIERYHSYDISWAAVPNANIQFFEHIDPGFKSGYPHGYGSFDGSITNFSFAFGEFLNPELYHGMVHAPSSTTNYYYRTRSWDEHGYSPYSGVVDIQVLVPSGGVPPATAPTITTPVQGANITANELYWVNWTSVPEATFYVLEEAEFWAPGPICGWPLDPLYHTYSDNRTSVQLLRHQWTGTKECYRVAAGNYYGLGPWSTILTVNLLSAPPPDDPDNPIAISDDFREIIIDRMITIPECHARLLERLENPRFAETIDTNGGNVEIFQGGRGDAEILAGLRSIVGISIADYDNDESLDIATVENNETVLVYDKHGQVIHQFTDLNECIGVCIGDFDGDEFNDLAISEYDAGNVTIFNMDGTPQNVISGLRGPMGNSIGDFNNDGSNEIAIAEYSSGSVCIYDNLAEEVHRILGLDRPQGVSIGDFNHNGYNDLAITLENGDVKIYFGFIDNRSYGDEVKAYDPYDDVIVNGSFLYLPLPAVSDSDYCDIGYESLIVKLIDPIGTSIGDFDGDEEDDIAITFDMGVRIYNQYGGLIEEIWMPDTRDVSIGDLDGDEENDIAISNFDSVIVYDRDLVPILEFFGLDDPKGVVIGDFDNDQSDDIAIAQIGRVEVYDRFGALFKEIWEVGDPQGIYLYDFNNDGFNDFTVLDELGGGNYSIKVFYEESRPFRASNPTPEHEATNVSWYIDLSWAGGDPDSEDTVTYDVYFGTNQEPPLVSSNQSGITYDPGTLENETKYYWRINSWDDKGLFTPGRLWSFTTKRNSNPNAPSDPSPEDDATNITLDVDLSWNGGDPDPEDTVTYDVYFGSMLPPEQVAAGQSETTYDPGEMAYNTTYYWRIVTHDNHGISTSGSIWDFTTQEEPSIMILYPTDDSFVDQWLPTTPVGSNAYLIVRTVSSLEISTLVKFDLSSIPPGTIISSAKVNLYHWHWNDVDPAGRSLDLHWITEDWDEDTVTYNTRPTWDPSSIGSAIVPSVPRYPDLSGEWMEWDITSEVQDIINEVVDNYGWQVMDHGGANPMIYFRSKENETDHPYLEIHLPSINNAPYTPSEPEPANGAVNISIYHDIGWSGGDPDFGDITTYDVYFGDSAQPPQIAWNHSNTTYDLDVLENSTQYFWRIVAWDDHGASAEGLIWNFTTEESNNPPETPSKPIGKTIVFRGEEETYATNTTDPESDDIYYMWDWDDGNFSEWLGPYVSGEMCEANYSWQENGTYEVKVKAKDVHNDESDWSEPLSIFILEGFFLNLADFPMYEAESDPGYNEMCGPAVAQMTLNYIWWNSSNHSQPPMLFDDQTWLYDRGRENNSNVSLPYLDTRGLWHIIQYNKPMPYQEFGYNFMKYNNEDLDEVLKRICLWINYTIGSSGGYKPGHPLHVPSVVPAYGAYTNWMAIRGFHSDKYAYPMPDNLTVYGFWVNDPLPGGIGENSYKTLDQWLSTYYSVLQTDDIYNGKYVAILEPPETNYSSNLIIGSSPPRFSPEEQQTLRLVQSKRNAISNNLKLRTNQWIIQAAIDGVTDELIPYDNDFATVFEMTFPGTPLYIESFYTGNNYYAVPFLLHEIVIESELETTPTDNDNAVVVVLIDADDGSFKEASWTRIPVPYLPLSKEEARHIAFKFAVEELGLEISDIDELKPELIHRKSTPYYPEWQILIENYGIYVSQDGAVTYIIFK